MPHIAILGAGAWGTALARALGEHGEHPRLWARHEAHARELANERENRRFLPGFALPESVSPTSDLGQALAGAESVLIAIPTRGVREVMERARAHIEPSASLIIASKGIEPGTLMLLTEVVADVLGSDAHERTVVLSGPSFANEVAQSLPTSLVAAARSRDLAQRIQTRFSSERLRVYASDDPPGVQVGGALKNVIAIAAGACDGLGFGHNTRAALITRGLAELARVSVAKGGSVLTLAGLSGLGDLVLTCTGELSRNRTVGFELGRGRRLEDALGALGHVAEGVTTAESAYHLALKLSVELPVCSEVYRVLYEHKPVRDAVRDVLARPLRREW